MSRKKGDLRSSEAVVVSRRTSRLVVRTDCSVVRILCGSLDNLASAFADLDQWALAEATPLARENRDSDLRRRVRVLLEHDTQHHRVAPKAAKASETGSGATVV